MTDEGTIKFASHWTASPPLDLAEIIELLAWREPLFPAALIGPVQDRQSTGRLDDFLQCIPTDIATADDDDDVLAPVVGRCLQKPGDGNSCGTFRQHVMGINQLPHAITDLFLRD